MKTLVFRNNKYLENADFIAKLRKAIDKFLREIFKYDYPVPTPFEDFEKEIIELINKIQDEQAMEEKNRRKRVRRCRTIKVHHFKSRKFIT